MNREFKDLFYEKLLLSELSFKEQSDFLVSMTSYLSHGRTEEINGRTLDYVRDRLNRLLEFLYALDFNQKEIVQIITTYPAILNAVDNLYEKYLFLGVIENMDDSLRRNKLLNKPRDFMIGLNKIYARYKLIVDSGYNSFTWNSLVHASDKEFSSIFIKTNYDKPYQIFDNELQVLDYLSSVDMSEFDLDVFKEMAVNEELVSRYESKGKRY